ncbi:alpha/beta hydrolase [Williamsia sp. M5A3_1d]
MTQAHAVRRLDISFESDGDTCAAWLFVPDGVKNPPVVILGHGLGATREMRLDAFAERFAAAGIAAMAFTYRHFGDSTGEPRQLLSISRQLADFDAGIAHLKARPDVDGTRIAVWGSSFGGGHAIIVASRHPELRAAIAQCPFTDGAASSRALGPVGTARLLPRVARDVLAAVTRRDPVLLTLAGAPGDRALMTAPDALPGYLALVPETSTFVNQVAARVAPTISMHRPGRAAKNVAMPILFCVCDHDSVTPPEETLRYAATAPHSEVKRYNAGHFDIYLGDAFEQVVADQTAFLVEHLGVTS